MHVEKWPNVLWKSCDVHTARFLKYVWTFFNTILEKASITLCTVGSEIPVILILISVLLYVSGQTVCRKNRGCTTNKLCLQ